MKKLISMLLVLVMLLCYIPTGVFAEEVLYTVAGTEDLCGSGWNPGDTSNQMTLNGDGLYEKYYEEVPAGNHEFKVTDGTWDNSWGLEGNNYTLTTEEVKNVLITFNPETTEITVTLSDLVPYHVAGTEDLCGSGWDPGDANNRMDKIGDGLYEKFYMNVPAGTHEFKITDGTWDNNWGLDGNNYSFTTDDVKNVVITFNEETKEIVHTIIDIEPYYVAGTDGLCGVGWDPGYADNKMSLGADGLYFKTFKNVQPGLHECKVTDGTWDNNWGLDGNNYSFTTEEAYNVTITFNPETKELGYILSEATPEEPAEPVTYDITINVHYYRPDAAYGDWEVHMWNGVESLNSTRKFAEELVEYEGKQWAKTEYFADASDVWVGFIIKTPAWIKDPDGDRKIDISDVTGGTVNVYAVQGSALEDFVVDKSQATLGAKVTAAVYDYKTSTIVVTTSYPIENPAVDTFQLKGPEGDMTISKIETIDELNYKVTYEGIIDEMNVYEIFYGDVACAVTIPNTYSTEEFEAEYTYEGDDLGASWTKDATTFRLWAPTAAAVKVNLYTEGEGGEKIESFDMTQDVNGTWIATKQGDLNGVYYTYSVTRKGETVEAVDPYARTTGVNGNRAMVIDLDSTDPAGWDQDTYVTQKVYTDAVIWELHVRDFSIDESSGMENKGKYLAFTENGTTVNGAGKIPTGVDYMKDLGVNYVHLLPVYDINSVDETTGGYNWGYDPKNYNVPEGSYSTDPYNGAVRVTEFKQMVQALHDNGIGVIMDVVYNHVADAGQFSFNQIVPGYFSRIHDDGSYNSDSGCGNDTASERAMVRKYIVDSVLYWAEEYHIDGFRWDLVGLIDTETINEVMEEVHKVNPDIIFYGEGWEMCSWTTKEGYQDKMTIQPNDAEVNTDAGIFAFFNDTIRNVIHGGVFTATDKGFVAGEMDEGRHQVVVDSYMGNSTWGSDNGTVDTPLQTINYASCHDNYTLFDNLTIDVMDMEGVTAAEAAPKAAAMNNLAAAYYITAQGVPFIHAGEEMLRSKPDAASESGFNHNSYSAGDEINSIKWASLEDTLVMDSYEYYKGLLAFRKAHPALRLTTEQEALTAMTELETGNTMVVAILNNGGNVEDAQILSIFNADPTEQTVTLPAGTWEVHVDEKVAGTSVLYTAEGTVNVAGTSAMILVKATEESVERVAGDNRFETAFQTADQMKETLGVEKFDVIVVASGLDYADALSGSYLASVKNAPILLASKDAEINALVKDYINKNLKEDGTIYILGGTAAVPESFETGLIGFKIARLAGDNRFETNLAILKEAGVEGKTILVSTGIAFADSLSASATGLPILLTYGDALLDSQKAFLAKGNDMVILGGTAAVSEKLETQLKEFGSVDRLAGATRLETSVLIALRFFDSPAKAILAYAGNFPDGLCGGPLATTMDAPLILTMPGYEQAAAEYIQDKQIKEGIVLGGAKLIPDASVNTIVK